MKILCLFALLLVASIGIVNAKMTRPGQYETVEEMAKWEKNAVNDIVRSVPHPPGDKGFSSSLAEGEDGDEDGDEHNEHDDAHGDGDDETEEQRLAGDVAEQGRLWNELTAMENDADAMVKHAHHQRGKAFQHAEDKLFDGAVRALHDVDRIDRDIQAETDAKKRKGAGRGGRTKQSLRFGPAAGTGNGNGDGDGGGGGGGVVGRRKRKSGASDWVITALFLSGLCLCMAGGAYLMFRRRLSFFPRDDPVDAAFDGEGAPYQL